MPAADPITLRAAVDRLKIEVHPSRAAAGTNAGKAAAAHLRALLAGQRQVRMIFACAPSQNEFLATLTAEAGIDWGRVTAFHMDEYLGLPANHPACFRAYLREHVTSLVPLGKTNEIAGDAADPEGECRRYASLLGEGPIDAVCLGIGENGHLAFNDPPVASFRDPVRVKLVDLDEACRRQQVNDGCFPSLGDVPRRAVTLTIPALLSGARLFCIVPGPRKAQAVERALRGPVAPGCPASILRTHLDATLYLDSESAARWRGEPA
ncbi:MAG: glucosamine-6-phosphate deaminase [Verrucomicrobia bacterium]|nr:glucosamine-6-phosphate deaminase [Verrucomicrobiota bacterium]